VLDPKHHPIAILIKVKAQNGKTRYTPRFRDKLLIGLSLSFKALIAITQISKLRSLPKSIQGTHSTITSTKQHSLIPYANHSI
jgi:hypothetical protein